MWCDGADLGEGGTGVGLGSLPVAPRPLAASSHPSSGFDVVREAQIKHRAEWRSAACVHHTGSAAALAVFIFTSKIWAGSGIGFWQS